MQPITAIFPGVAGPPATAASVSVAAFAAAPARLNLWQIAAPTRIPRNAVSYTHLAVYKRQDVNRPLRSKVL